MKPAKQPNRTWQQFWADNFQWLLASLALAFGIWLVATTENDPVDQRTFPRTIPIQFEIGEAMTYSSPSTESAQLSIRAPSSQWNELRADQITVIADLRELGPGDRQRVELRGELADDVRGRVVQVVPSSILVNVAELGQQRIAIDIDITQEPPSGYSYPAPRCDLTEVTASGPAHLLEGLVAKARINLRDARNPVTTTVNLFAADADGRSVPGITLEPSQLSCTVEITQNEGVTELFVRPDMTGFPAAGYIYEGYELDPETVIVSGQQFALRQLGDIVETEPISLNDASSTFQQTVGLKLPDGVVLEPPSQSVTVTVRIGTIRGSRQYTDIPVEVVGLTPGLRAEILPTTVSVFVVGPRPLLRELNSENMRVVVDVAALLEPGSYQVAPRMAITVESIAAQVSNDTEITIQPVEITVTISGNPTPDS